MSKLKLTAIHFIIILVMLLLPHKAYLQATGSISGKVCVMGGAPLSGVTVKATHNDSREIRTAVTDDSGNYKITGLPAGVYTLNFTKTSYQRSQMRGVKVVADVTTACELLEMIWETVSSTGGGDNLSGRELMQITRVAQGAAEYEGLQYLTARSQGFVNVAPFAAVGLGTGGAALAGQVEVRVNITDYQDKEIRRRLDVSPAGAALGGPTFLVYTGTEGGGMFLGNPFRVSEVAASRQWAMMGFGTLNRAADGTLRALRQRDETYNGQPHYVVEVVFNPTDTVRFWINKRTFLTSKVQTRYNSRVLVEEDRSDYRKVSCLMLPFRVVTRLTGQRMADLTIDSYDIQTVVPSARFSINAGGE
jgi:hypothetical protein